MSDNLSVITYRWRTQAIVTTLVDASQREKELCAVGVPAAFLAALGDPDQLGDLQFLITSAEKTYGYYRVSPQLYQRDIADLVVPVFADGNGDYFVDLVFADDRHTYCKTYLESGTREELGSSFNAVFFHLTIALWEFADESDARIAQRMHSLGYPHATELVSVLPRADRDSFDTDRDWRKQNISVFV
ncbi:MAG: hypothetical protein ABGZ53_32405 [Fuerstiella sp.]